MSHQQRLVRLRVPRMYVKTEILLGLEILLHYPDISVGLSGLELWNLMAGESEVSDDKPRSVTQLPNTPASGTELIVIWDVEWLSRPAEKYCLLI